MNTSRLLRVPPDEGLALARQAGSRDGALWRETHTRARATLTPILAGWNHLRGNTPAKRRAADDDPYIAKAMTTYLFAWCEAAGVDPDEPLVAPRDTHH